MQINLSHGKFCISRAEIFPLISFIRIILRYDINYIKYMKDAPRYGPIFVQQAHQVQITTASLFLVPVPRDSSRSW
jgi:hypothetical protein